MTSRFGLFCLTCSCSLRLGRGVGMGRGFERVSTLLLAANSDFFFFYSTRSRWTMGVRKSFSMRSASPNRSSRAEANVRCKFQVDATRDHPADIAFVAIKCIKDFFFVAAAERHDVNRGAAADPGSCALRER